MTNCYEYDNNGNIKSKLTYELGSTTELMNSAAYRYNMLERLNGDEKGDAIVSVRGYEPIWARFTPSYELKDVYFAAGKADISKREARLFEKREYVFDILGGSQTKEEDAKLDGIDRREREQEEEEKKPKVNVADLDKQWNAKQKEVHEKILKAAEALIYEDAEALVKAKLEDKITLIRIFLENYDMSVQQKLKALISYLEQELPKLLDLQEQAKIYKEKK